MRNATAVLAALAFAARLYLITFLPVILLQPKGATP